MAANVEKLLLKIKADLADLKQLQVELANVRKQGQETSSSLTSAFAGVAKVFGALKLKGVFDSAVADARNLERTVLGLQATARLTGNNFRELNKQVQDLASDGVLSIDRASQSMKVLLAQGLSANKAFELIDAAKKVGSFNNIVGDTGQSVQDFIKFLQTGSAELAENLDPSLVKVVKSLGGYEKVANNAAAKQQLINAVIAKGKSLTEDYAKFLDSGAQAQVNFDSATLKLSQTFGSKLAPAYSAIQNGLAKLKNGITDFVASFKSSTVSIVAGTALAIVALQGVGGALSVLSVKAGGALSVLSVKAAAAWAVILGPLSLIVAAIGAVALATKALQDRFGNTKGQDLLEERKALLDIKAKQDLTITQKERLKQLNGEIAKSYDPILEKLGLQNRSLEDQLRIVRAIDKAREEAKESTEDAVKLETTLRQRIADREAILKAEGNRTDFSGFTESQLLERTDRINRLAQAIEEDKAALAAIEVVGGKGAGATPLASGSGKFVEARYTDLETELKKSLSDFERTIDIVNAREAKALERLANPEKLKGESAAVYKRRVEKFRESDEFKAQRAEIESRAGQERADAAAKQNEIFENGIARVRQSQAEFIEDRTTAELEALKQKTIQEEGNVFRLLNAKQISEKEAESQLQKIREANARKTVKIYMDSLTASLNAGGQIANALTKVTRGDAAGFGEGLSGLGGLGSGLSGLGVIEADGTASKYLGAAGIAGTAASAVVGIGSALGSLFGKSDEERRKEAAEQAKRDEEVKKILEAQEGYQKSLLALQEAQAQLPFNDLNRQLRLIDIQAQQKQVAGVAQETIEKERLEARKTLVSSVIQQKASAIGEGRLFSNIGSTPEELIGVLSEGERLRTLVTPLASLLQQLRDSVYNGSAQSTTALQELVFQELTRLGYPSGFRQINATTRFGEYDERLYSTTDESNLTTQDKLVRTLLQSGGTNFSELNIDIKTAENLLGAIETQLEIDKSIADSTKKTSENTKKLDLLDPRKLSFIDLVRNSVFSQGLKVDFQKVQLPTAVSSTILASATSPAVPSDTLAAMRRMVDLMDEANDYLAVIAENTNKNSTDDVDISDNRLIGRINSIKGRSIS